MDCKQTIFPGRNVPWKVLEGINSGLESSCVIMSANKGRRRGCGEIRRACFKRRKMLAGGLPRETDGLSQRAGSKVGRGPWLFRNRQCLMVASVDSTNESHGEEDRHQPASEGNGTQTNPLVAISESLSSGDFWLQVGIFLFAAGFVDAGFSGDWSRIGVLSKEVEVELQIACIGIVPLAATLIWSIAERQKNL